MKTCSWNNPGQNPYQHNPVLALNSYKELSLQVRSELKAKMQVTKPDDIVEITRDSIKGKFSYSADLYKMHFGNGQVCDRPDRSQWSNSQKEIGLVYCSGSHCVVVPTVCNNVSLIQKEKVMPATIPQAPQEMFITHGVQVAPSFNPATSDVALPEMVSFVPAPTPFTSATAPVNTWTQDLNTMTKTPPWVPPVDYCPPVPEPSTLAMAIIGVAALMFLKRKNGQG